MALAQGKPTVQCNTALGKYQYGVKSGVQVLVGALVILASGFARPGREGQGADNAAKAVDAATYQAVGVAQETVTGAGADGDVKVNVVSAEWLFKNSAAGDAIVAADIGKDCYIVDDETVAKTNPNSTRARAGKITQVDATGVVVRVGPGL